MTNRFFKWRLKALACGFAVAALVATLFACDDLHSLDQTDNLGTAGTGALYVLSDGNFGLNNSTLAVCDFDRDTLFRDYFQVANGRKLGDTGNDLKRYGSKLYVVVNGSGQLEVLDARTGKSLRQLSFFNGAVSRQPRCVAFWENKAYVCSFDGTVAKIDTASLQIEGYLQLGRNPDGITASNGKIYVSNSGGLDYNSSLGYDNTVSVVSTESFTELKRIVVGSNPGQLQADLYGNVWAVVRGNYGSLPGTWVCIDAQTDAVVTTVNLEVTRFDIAGDKAYFYCWDEQTGANEVGVYNVRTKHVETLDFISDGTTLDTPYGIHADAESGSVFLTDAGNFSVSGDVYCFNEQGKRMYTVQNVGVNPNSVLPINDFLGSNGAALDTTLLALNGIETVFDFTPAPGQFVGVYPFYETGATKAEMLQRVEAKLKGNAGGLVSLGRYGGSVTFGFSQPVRNLAGNDLKVFGNAFLNSAEPGIVEVSEDVNGNGLPDDTWYELAGSKYADATTVHSYSITYYKPVSDSIRFRDNQALTGYVTGKYPPWEGDSIVCRGSRLASTAYQTDAQFWVLANLAWGYADNQPNTSDLTEFNLDWAVDDSGNSVVLSRIHFVRVYTGVNQSIGWLGELSTEVTGALNLHP
jgi:hypothetical protein